MLETDARIAERLREAYALLDSETYINQQEYISDYSLMNNITYSPSILLNNSLEVRELFTVTLNLEYLLRPREVEALITLQEKYLKWYNNIYNFIRKVYDIRPLLRYWVKGIVVYEFNEITRCIGGGDDVDDINIIQSNNNNNNNNNESNNYEAILQAIEYAMELQKALHRLPLLVEFLFKGRLSIINKSQQEFSEVVNDIILSELRDVLKIKILQRILMGTLQLGRRCQNVVVNSLQNSLTQYNSFSHHHHHHHQNYYYYYSQQEKKLEKASVDICKLIKIFSPDNRLYEEQLVMIILKSVVNGCKNFFPNDLLISLLDPVSNDASRHIFLIKTWPKYWKNELKMMQKLPCVEEAWVKGILVKLVFLWDFKSDTNNNNNNNNNINNITINSINNSPNSTIELHSCYLYHILLLTLKPLFEDLFGINSSEDVSMLLNSNNNNSNNNNTISTNVEEVESEFSLVTLSSLNTKQNSLKLLLDIANSMSCIEIPPRRILRIWNQIGAGIALSSNIPIDIGYNVMSDVCRELLNTTLSHVIGNILNNVVYPTEEKEKEKGKYQYHHQQQYQYQEFEKSWSVLLHYLLRTERIFNRLCDVWQLKARLINSENNGIGCFYNIIENAIIHQRGRKLDIELLVNSVLDSIHMYLFHLSNRQEGLSDVQSGEQITSSSNNNNNNNITTKTVVISVEKVAVILRNREELRSALRIALSVASADNFLHIYKELLSYRLLSPILGRSIINNNISSVDASELWREKLQMEKFVCEYLQELLPSERDIIRQMIQMCTDLESNNNLQEMYSKQQQQEDHHHHQYYNEGNIVKLNIRLLSRLVWPSYPILNSIPNSLKDSMNNFSTFYHKKHCNRRIVWLRTSLETITFNVAYPNGSKVITSSLELFEIFQYLSEAGISTKDMNADYNSIIGITWTQLAQYVKKDRVILQRELRKLMSDGFFIIHVQNNNNNNNNNNNKEIEERICLNSEFKSKRSHYRFLQPPPRVGTISEENNKISNELIQSRIASTQAAIIKQMKSVRSCYYDELFRLTQQSIKQFKLQNSDFKISLEQLIEKEYVERDSTQKQLFVYKA